MAQLKYCFSSAYLLAMLRKGLSLANPGSAVQVVRQVWRLRCAGWGGGVWVRVRVDGVLGSAGG